MREVLQQLDIDDFEHPSVSLTHETEWSLGAIEGGTLVWENVESDDIQPRHMHNVSREKILELWLKLAQGDIASIELEPWLPGYD